MLFAPRFQRQVREGPSGWERNGETRGPGREIKKTGNERRKKIRAIQYGVGPIGAALVRLMREKQAIEIIGAIDTDPAKAGRDLGEVAGAADAPWGIPVSATTDLL